MSSTGRTSEPLSYWHATGAPLVPGDSLPEATDVVVVGGGVLGVWATYWLAKAGVDVTLIERDAISWGATGRNGGFVGAGLVAGIGPTAERIGEQAAWDLWKLTEDGCEIVRRVVAEEGIDCDYRVPGSLGFILGDADLDARRAGLGELAARGITAEVLDRDALQNLVKTPLGDEIAGAMFQPNSAAVHSSKYLSGVAAAAGRHGARLCRAAVTALEASGNGALVITDRGSVRAGRVIVSVNAWTDELVPALSGLVVPVRGQILSYEPLPEVFTTGGGAAVTPTGEYWQQTPDGSIVIGGCRDDAPNKDVGVRDPVPTSGVISRIEEVLPRLFPKLEGLRVAHTWAGLMAFTSDFLPVAGPAPGMPGVWVGGGFCGGGMSFGPRLGQLLAEAATTGATPASIAPLSAERSSLTHLTDTAMYE